MLCSVRSLGLTGLNGYEVQVECYISNGLPGFDMVGYRVHTGYTSKIRRTPPRLEGFFLFLLITLLKFSSILRSTVRMQSFTILIRCDISPTVLCYTILDFFLCTLTKYTNKTGVVMVYNPCFFHTEA